ncbi:hypothetical protein [Yoonia sp.]|uniref:hypothetical protein n=1 Tax=Yoonia sp. TaxID=2212373 RepID=UPI0025FA02C1|nr:hypothetical protein [Yoonia sp.]
MTYTLSDPLQIGGRTLIVVSRGTTHARQVGATMLLHGNKTPVYVLIRHNGHITVLDMDGASVAPAAMQRLCPGALQRIREAPKD